MRLARLALCVGLVLGHAVVGAELPAFPGAEGFGMASRGGRGGTVIAVTSLSDYVPGREEQIAGSLRAACSAAKPRIIVFHVAGTIDLKAGLRISEPYLTIAGQTAPGGGICLKNFGVGIRTHDVVLRYLRLRPGDEIGREYKKQGKPFDTDALCVGTGSRRVIIDHCSTSWANDEVLSVSGEEITDITVQWCMITESLNRSFHHKGAHGFGSLIRCNGNVTFHHNIYAYHVNRSPRPGTYGDGSILLDFRNNLVCSSLGYSGADPVRMNYVGNVFKDGGRHAFKIGGKQTRVYAEDNWVFRDGKLVPSGWDILRGDEKVSRMRAPFDIAAVRTDSGLKAYEKLLNGCGATRPTRDAVDRRVIDAIRRGKGAIIDSQRDVGGWPELRSRPCPKDSDGDAMPDTWERTHGLDPELAGDGPRDADRDGYTNVEEYLNGTDPRERN